MRVHREATLPITNEAAENTVEGWTEKVFDRTNLKVPILESEYTHTHGKLNPGQTTKLYLFAERIISTAYRHLSLLPFLPHTSSPTDGH